jgi:hypothetical protein
MSSPVSIGMLYRRSSGSIRSRIWYISSHSAGLSRETQAPVLATRVTSPSASSIRSASRTGSRLAPCRPARSS